MKQHQFLNTSKILGGVTLYDKCAPAGNDVSLQHGEYTQAILQNRQALADEINLPLNNWVLARQEHTANFYEVGAKDKGKGSIEFEQGIAHTDALYTTQSNILIGAMTADCVGILLVDETTPCIATIHSGWKGTLQSITTKTVKHLIQQGLIHPKSTKAYFSPSILYDSLEMGVEVIDQFRNAGFDLTGYIKEKENGKYLLDNQGLNIKMLKDLGIHNITPSSIDTFTNVEDTFSYRRKMIGRHMTYAMIKEDVQ